MRIAFVEDDKQLRTSVARGLREAGWTVDLAAKGPEALDLVVMKCLKKRIVDRPKSAEELEAMLAAIPAEGLPLSYDRRPKRGALPPPSEEPGTVSAITSSDPPPPAK